MSEILLYRALAASRAFPVLRLPEELGLGYRSEIIKLKDWVRPEALMRLTPTGKVPAIVDGETVVTEAPAICPRTGGLLVAMASAPKVGGELERGPYLKWMVWSTAVLEPARELQLTTVTPPRNDWGVGWPAWELVLKELADAVTDRTWLLGERFSAADVMLGSVLSIGLFCEMIPPIPALVAYNERLAARPARQKAEQSNWPADMFPAAKAE